ncbi:MULTISPECIES: 2-hydroxychromene-2-carboxylate isomerase [unclassified Ruegeria]|uniref:2-hydroxychromene-2-carboxylate isomerase n=1 Tax=unclassified Ruegeria TaxID=2625375 RepID=UPI001487F740|nr:MULTISPECIES: 2-hydroxychromene-2-carboxylate isomerase [unclassified Ruegeria]NOD36883.1 2-hydroxychromene-2-carboxylate isomerase [Ruegeria sp. HKCCD7296]NOD47133.1 2-hydroxychromene-2-carboxylate isomerase [Ruegeria sp. HKCCD5849]NOD51456.1 2-hydroxychromene-2-carboxylate isomerase [Ruegeria sp. HKCCD5851]NOD69399.1 2-hydroxychromene-2-carboxylate isomerase [Ruegeria sp. HKCCD7303]NOE36015.1 2-hydroxychromene-2-carboxylate isomerase [Ruegeria sp. HKCCD7318]
MTQIDYYFATISPYTYLAGNRLEEVAAKHDATINYKPLDIMALFARTGGTAPKDRHISRIEYRAQDLLRQAKRLGVEFNLKPAHWPTNMAPSSYAVIAAAKDGSGDVGKLCQLILRACWAEEKDVSQDDVIRECLANSGFDPDLANSGLLVGAETYATNLEEAVDQGAFGAPFYITPDGQRFWGQDSLDDLDNHLAEMKG